MQDPGLARTIEPQTPLRHAHARAQVGPERHVLENRHARKQLNVLESSADAATGDLARQLAIDALAHEPDCAGGERGHARDEVERGAFAGAVRADQANDLSGAHRETEVVDCDKAAELLADRVNAQYRLACLRPSTRGKSRRRRGRGPPAG